MKINIKSTIFSLILILLLVSNHIGLPYYGELICGFFGVYLLLYVISKKKMSKETKKILFFIFLLCVVGLLSNYTSGIKRSKAMIAKDILTCFKSYLCLVAGLLYGETIDLKIKEKVLKSFKNILKIFIICSFICFIISLFTNIGMSDDIRFGIKSFKFIFLSAAWLSQYFAGIIAVYVACLYKNRNRFDIIVLILGLIVWMSSLRSRAFAMIAIFVFLWFFIIIGREKNDYKKKVINMPNIILLSSLAFLIGEDQIQKYFFNSNGSARLLLLKNGIKIMKDYFPLGTGFGTYATQVAAVNYSPLYYKYNLSSFWALKEGGGELVDGFWPSIFGQFGIIGVVISIVIIYNICKLLINNSRHNKYIFTSILTYVIYILISSTATAIFYTDLTAIFLLIIAVISTIKEDNNDEDNSSI